MNVYYQRASPNDALLSCSSPYLFSTGLRTNRRPAERGPGDRSCSARRRWFRCRTTLVAVAMRTDHQHVDGRNKDVRRDADQRQSRANGCPLRVSCTTATYMNE